MKRKSFEARRRSYVRWGLATFLLAAFSGYAAFGGPLPTGSGYEVRAILRTSTELRPDSAVRIAGVDVGKVKRIERGPGTTAVVTMQIRDSARPVHADATLKVRPRLFLEGNFFVDLRPGSPSAPELPDGGKIPLTQTAAPVQLDQVLTALNADSRADLQGLVGELATSMRRGGARSLGAALEPAGGAFANTAVTARALRGVVPGDLAGAIADAGRVTAALDSRRDQLAGLIAAFDTTAAALASRDAELRATVRELAGTLREARPAVRDVREALPSVARFARDARPLVRRAPRTMDLARPLLRELDALLQPSALPRLTRSLRPPLRTLAALQPDLDALLRRVTPVTDCVRDQALPALTTPVEDGKHSTGRAPWQELLYGMVGLASASQDFDGNGPSVRYLSGFGEQLISTGQLPSVGRLQGRTNLPLEGARPAPPQAKPPFRPGAPCAEQDPVKLDAPAVGAPPAQQAPPITELDQELLEDALESLVPEARR